MYASTAATHPRHGWPVEKEGVAAMPEPRHLQVALRDVDEGDLDSFFDHQGDEEASRMAAFTVENPHDRNAFDAHWSRILADPAIVNRTVVVDAAVAGHVAAYQSPDLEGTEVTYWIGRAFWGAGVATSALRLLLDDVPQRPLYARCAETNPASLRVLQKCGFTIVGEDVGYSNAHGKDVREYIVRLDT